MDKLEYMAEEFAKSFVEGLMTKCEPNPFDPAVWSNPVGMSAEEVAQSLKKNVHALLKIVKDGGAAPVFPKHSHKSDTK